MAIGKLSNYDEEFIANVDYRLHNGSVYNWWGEFTLTEYQRLEDGDGYIIELEDGRRGKCFLRKKVNRAVYGLLPLFCYHFKGNGSLE